MALTRFLPIICLGLVALLLAVGLKSQVNMAPQPAAQAGKPLPVLHLAKLDNAEEDFLLPTGEPYLLNFFASWCAGCQIEHPVLKTASADLPIYGIAWRDSPKDAARWLEQKGNFYHQVGMDVKGLTAVEIGLTGVPESYFITGDGIIAGVYKGPITEIAYDDWLKPLIEQHGLTHEQP